MPQFDISSFSSQLFWLVIVFGFLYFLISKFIAPKAEYILSQRDAILEENITEAENYNNKAKVIELLKENNLIEVNAHIDDLYSQATNSLDRDFIHQKNDLSLVLDKKKKNALLEVENYIAGFHANEPTSCIRLAAFIIEKITNKKPDIDQLLEIHGRIK